MRPKTCIGSKQHASSQLVSVQLLMGLPSSGQPDALPAMMAPYSSSEQPCVPQMRVCPMKNKTMVAIPHKKEGMLRYCRRLRMACLVASLPDLNSGNLMRQNHTSVKY